MNTKNMVHPIMRGILVMVICTLFSTISLAQDPPIGFSLEVAECICGDNSPGAINLTVNPDQNMPIAEPFIAIFEGPNGYAYSPSTPIGGVFPQVIPSAPVFEEGTYTITITNAYGCDFTQYITVNRCEEVLPYIKTVEVYAKTSSGDTELIYEGLWEEQGSCISYSVEYYPTNLDVTDIGIEIRASISQPVNGSLQVNLPDASPSVGYGQSSDGINFIANFPQGVIGYLANSASNNSQEIIFEADNILDLRALSAEMSQCVEIPELSDDCSWPSPPPTDKDDVHIFDFSCVTVSADIIELSNGNNGEISLNINGTPPYNLAWTGPSINFNNYNSAVISNLSPGTYCVAIKDGAGCSFNRCYEMVGCNYFQIITQELLPPCEGTSNGSLCVRAEKFGQDNNSLYNFQWSNGQVDYGVENSCIENLSPGTYDVTVMDVFCGYVRSTSFTIPNPSSPSLSADITSACHGNNNGSISLQVSEGRPPYIYIWNTGETTNTIDGLGAGTYGVTVEDACGSAVTNGFVVEQSPETNFSVEIINNSPQNPGCNGSISITPDNNTAGPFSYYWGGRLTGSTITDLCSGIYEVTITDNFGCTYKYQYEVINCSGSSTLSVIIDDAENCNDGGIRIVGVSTPNSPLTIDWPNNIELSSSGNPINLSSGNYTATLTDGISCVNTQTFEVGGLNGLDGVVFDIIGPACEGMSNGRVEAIPTFFINGLQISWSNGENSFTAENLPGGLATVTITDINDPDCSLVRSVDVPELDVTDFEIILDIEQPCPPDFTNGSVSISMEGGNEPFTYVIKNGNNIYQNGNLEVGSYEVEVTDYCGTINTASFDIEFDIDAEFDILTTLIEYPNSLTANNGQISVEASGNGLYSYEWNTGQVGNTISGLPGQTSSFPIYSVTVTDLNRPHCYQVKSFELNFCTISGSISNPQIPPYEAFIDGGIFVNSSTTLSAMIVEDGVLVNPIPDNYVIKWYTGSNVIGYGPTVNITDSYSFIQMTVSNGCDEQTIFKPLISCNETNPEILSDFFIIQENLPCEGFADGNFTIQVPNPENQPVTIIFDGIIRIDNSTSNPVLETILGTSSNTSYNIQIQIGEECSFTFNHIVEGLPLTEEVQSVGFSSGGGIFPNLSDLQCNYHQYCGSQFIQETSNQAVVGIGLGTSYTIFNDCEAPIFCNGEEVGEIDLKKIKVSGQEYFHLLTTAFFAGVISEADYSALLSEFERKKVQPCDKVKYCPGDFQITFVFDHLPGAGEIIDLGGGCYKVLCKWPRKDYTFCENDIVPYVPINPDLIPNCSPKQASYFELWLMDQAGLFEGTPYEESELQTYVNLAVADPAFKCMGAVYCCQTLEVIFEYSTNEMACGSDTGAFPPGVCGSQIGNEDPNTTVMTQEELQHEVWCGNFSFCSDCSSGISPNFNYYYAFPSQGQAYESYPCLFEETPVGLVVNDIITPMGSTYSNEQFLDFGIIRDNGVSQPKGIIKNNEGYFLYEYVKPGGYNYKNPIKGFTLFEDDWDNNQLIGLEEKEENKECSLSYLSSETLWELTMSSDNYVHILDISKTESEVNIIGEFSDKLSISPTTVLKTQSTALFELILDHSGTLIKYNLIENIEKNSSIISSGNDPIIMGKASGNIKFDDTVPPGFESADIWYIFREGEAIIPVKSSEQDLELLDIAESEEGNMTIIAKSHSSLIINDFNSEEIIDQESIQIINIDNEGNILWNSAIDAENISFDNLSLISGDKGEIFIGLTFSNTINIFETELHSNGETDIAIISISQEGNYQWSKVYGTDGKETISKIMYDNNSLFFGGEFWSNRGIVPIGNHSFINSNPDLQKAYITYISADQEITDEVSKRSFNKSEAPKTSKLSVIPNPFEDELTISFQVVNSTEAEVVLYDELGNLLKRRTLNIDSGYNETTINTSDLISGVYFVQIFTPNEEINDSKRIIKIK